MQKNSDSSTVNPTMKLAESNVFKNYVLNDLLQSTSYYIHDASLMNPSKFADFRKELSIAKQENLPNIFAKYQLDFHLFKQFQINRITNQMLALTHFPEIAHLPENEINKIFNDAYTIVSNRTYQYLKKKENKYPSKTYHHPEADFTENRHKSSINTVKNMNDELYFSIQNNLSVSDELAEQLIYTQILNYTAVHSITFGEAMDCLSHAIGWGGGTMGGLVGWSRAIAGLAIQEAVIVATRWALMHIGWLGVAVTTYTLTSCLINAY